MTLPKYDSVTVYTVVLDDDGPTLSPQGRETRRKSSDGCPESCVVT